MHRWSESSEGSPAAAWALYARPGRWSEWAPHLRGAWGLGGDEVRVGARGAVRLLGVLPVPARITAVDATPPTRSWAWRVGPVDMTHRVEPQAGGGCVVALELTAAGPLEPAVAAAYGPVVALLLRRLAARAASSAPGER